VETKYRAYNIQTPGRKRRRTGRRGEEEPRFKNKYKNNTFSTLESVAERKLCGHE